MCMYGPKVWTWAHIARAFARAKSTETGVKELCQQKSLNPGCIPHQKGVSVYKRNLVPSVHVVLHLRPCICSRSSFYWRLLLYKPGSGALSHSQTFFCRLEPFSLELLTTSLVQTERKTQMLGLELSGLIGEHVIHFHFESFLIVCLPKRPEENVYGEV